MLGLWDSHVDISCSYLLSLLWPMVIRTTIFKIFECTIPLFQFTCLLCSFPVLFFPLGSPEMLSILCWWWNCAWDVCSIINHIGGMLWAVTRGPRTSFISRDRPGYVVVTSSSQNQWIREVMVYFCSCNTSFKGQLGLCSTPLQNPADVTAVILSMKCFTHILLAKADHMATPNF